MAQSSCTCTDEEPTHPPLALLPCRAAPASGPEAPALDPAIKKTVPGTIGGGCSVSTTGEVTCSIGLDLVPSRLKPELAITYDSSGGDGPLGVGFSLAGISSITRCPQSLALDGEIRDVRFDAADKLCLDGRRLIPVGEGPGVVEYRTLPDTFIKVIGHFAADAKEKTPNNVAFFEAFAPSGLVTEYGGAGGRPLARGGASESGVRPWFRALFTLGCPP